MLLPDVTDDAGLDAVRSDLEAFRPGLDVICKRHRLSGERAAFEAGSLPVFALGEELVVKLYEPRAPEDFTTESMILARLSGRLPVPAPEPLHEGELDGWRYLVMRRVEGVPLETLLDGASEAERRRVGQRAGELVAALHAVSIAGVPTHSNDFAAFIARRVDEHVATHAARGLGDPWLSRLRDAALTTPPMTTQAGLLHTELGPGHLLARRSEHGIELTGMIDFIDAMPGPPEYDFAAFAFFVARGDAVTWETFLDGYGWPADDCGSALRLRVMQHLLLHRFSSLQWMLSLRPPPEGTDTLAALEADWLVA